MGKKARGYCLKFEGHAKDLGENVDSDRFLWVTKKEKDNSDTRWDQVPGGTPSVTRRGGRGNSRPNHKNEKRKAAITGFKLDKLPCGQGGRK